MVDIFKISALGVCKKLQSDEKTAFVGFEFKEENEFRNRELPLNFILFVLKGTIEISCNQYENCLIQPGQMILLVRNSSVHVRVLPNAMLSVMYFDHFLSSCDQQLFTAYLPDVKKIKYDFVPITIPQPIHQFLDHIRSVQELKAGCMHYNSLKHREFFILLRYFCPRADLVMFLYPLISYSVNFRNKVLEKFALIEDGRVTELAGLVGMGRKNFDKQFKKEFGTSPAQWMLQEKAKRLYMFLKEPEVTIADAMDRFYFNSSAHFNRFCLRYFKKTPGTIIKEANKNNKNETIKIPV